MTAVPGCQHKAPLPPPVPAISSCVTTSTCSHNVLSQETPPQRFFPQQYFNNIHLHIYIYVSIYGSSACMKGEVAQFQLHHLQGQQDTPTSGRCAVLLALLHLLLCSTNTMLFFFQVQTHSSEDIRRPKAPSEQHTPTTPSNCEAEHSKPQHFACWNCSKASAESTWLQNTGK